MVAVSPPYTPSMSRDSTWSEQFEQLAADLRRRGWILASRARAHLAGDHVAGDSS
jgi:hypothetical protein